jgi:hypothetical protein
MHNASISMQELESNVYPIILYRDHVLEALYPAQQYSQVLIYDDVNLDRATPCSQRCWTCQQCLQWKKMHIFKFSRHALPFKCLCKDVEGICPFKDRGQIENGRLDASPFGILSHCFIHQPLRPFVNRKDFDFQLSLKSKK